MSAPMKMASHACVRPHLDPRARALKGYVERAKWLGFELRLGPRDTPETLHHDFGPLPAKWLYPEMIGDAWRAANLPAAARAAPLDAMRPAPSGVVLRAELFPTVKPSRSWAREAWAWLLEPA